MVTAVRAPHGRARWGDPLVVDGLLALLVTGLALASLVGRVAQVRLTDEGSVRFNTADVLGVVLLLLGTLSLAWRRRAPLAVLGVSGAAFFAYQTLGYAPPPLPFALLIALYTVAASRPPALSASATGALAAGVGADAVTQHGPLTEDQFLAYLIAVVAAWMLGYGVQLGRARTSFVEEQAARAALEQTVKTQLAVEQEQARIARELHDIVAHNVSVIVAQAGAARRVFDAEPEQARQALGSIEIAGRGALSEMRLLLGVLRADRVGQQDRAPQPGLDRLPSLIAQIERAGLPVELSIHGEPRPLPAGVELNAYRIVQEALTNSLKHAGPTRAHVVLSYDAESLELLICDDGRGGPRNITPGHGLVGMRQRAALLGGELAVGPVPAHRPASGPGQGSGTGFRVTARLPVNSERL